ncbi:MAG: hypothetical protein IJ068_00825 [Bacilli bacterium]|nr:hypothetical protein [Bacilli bacterium]
MKKNIIIVILLGSLFGFIVGGLIFKNYSGTDYLESDGNIYYLQYGVYTTRDAAVNNSQNINHEYFIREMDDKYYVYLGVTTDLSKANELKQKYENENIHIYIRDDYVENSETLEKLKQYDLEMNEDNIETVMKEIFENTELNL